jgi:hypothetical protein
MQKPSLVNLKDCEVLVFVNEDRAYLNIKLPNGVIATFQGIVSAK